MAIQRIGWHVRAAKAAALGACVLLAGLFVASAYYAFIWQNAGLNHLIVVRKGAVCYKWRVSNDYLYNGFILETYLHPDTRGWHYEKFILPNWPLTWLPEVGVDPAMDYASWEGVIIPLWMPFLPLLAVTLWLWWRCRPAPVGFCSKCWYDLTGNLSGRCPECGTTVAAHRVAQSPQRANEAGAEAP